MHVIGIVGGVASGKSTVSGMLRDLGAVVLNADQAGHEALCEPKIIEVIQNRWGIDVIRADGQVDRSAVAARVFGDVPNASRERKFLESITHPRIQAHLRRQIEAANRNGETAVVLDAPLLFEGGWDKVCDTIIFVDAPLEDRLQRVAARDWSADELKKRESFQLPLQTKKERSNVVIQNDGSVANTQTQITQFWRLHVNGPPN